MFFDIKWNNVSKNKHKSATWVNIQYIKISQTSLHIAYMENKDLNIFWLITEIKRIIWTIKGDVIRRKCLSWYKKGSKEGVHGWTPG